MRAIALAVLLAASGFSAASAESTVEKEAIKPLHLVLPINTDDCLKTLEKVLERTLDADLLDDQIDEAEGRFEKLETACIDGRFAEALEEAVAIEKLVAMNK